MNKNPAIRFIVLAAVTFLVSFVFINWFLSSWDIQYIPTSQLWTPSYVMGAVTLVCAILMPTKPLILAPIAIASILIGVAFDALTDRTMDRNLFPIEMIIWAGFATPGIFAGAIAGSVIYWIRMKMHNRVAGG